METLFHFYSIFNRKLSKFLSPSPSSWNCSGKGHNSSQKSTLKGHLELSTALNTVDFCLLKGLCCLGFPILLSSLAPPTQSPLSAVLPFTLCKSCCVPTLHPCSPSPAPPSHLLYFLPSLELPFFLTQSSDREILPLLYLNLGSLEGLHMELLKL